MTSAGLPHSDIRGSRPAGDSPRLFAAYYVLLRLLAPRHPPRALSNSNFEYQSGLASRIGLHPAKLNYLSIIMHLLKGSSVVGARAFNPRRVMGRQMARTAEPFSP